MKMIDFIVDTYTAPPGMIPFPSIIEFLRIEGREVPEHYELRSYTVSIPKDVLEGRIASHTPTAVGLLHFLKQYDEKRIELEEREEFISKIKKYISEEEK